MYIRAYSQTRAAIASRRYKVSANIYGVGGGGGGAANYLHTVTAAFEILAKGILCADSG